ncbi:retrovirus-related pol polyprotein from transposon TNT 1-94 [Tanacetum coccineum]
MCIYAHTSRYAIDVEPIPPHNRNNREVHLDYLKHLKKSVETLRKIVEEAKVERPLDRSLAFACLYTKQSQELLEYVLGTCPKDFNQRDKKHVATPLTRKSKLLLSKQCTDASRLQPRSTTKKTRISLAKSVNNKHDEVLPNLFVVQSLQEQIMVMASSFEPLELRIFHQKSVPRTPQHNGVVERWNRTLVEATRAMLIFSKAPMFLWAEAVAIACYTQNRSLIHNR